MSNVLLFSFSGASSSEDRIADYNSVTDPLVICDTSLLKAYVKRSMDASVLKVFATIFFSLFSNFFSEAFF
jgi:hypothetical protein